MSENAQFLLFLFGCLALMGLYFWNVKRMRERAQQIVERFKILSNVDICFMRDLGFVPSAQEVNVVSEVFIAALSLWPTHREFFVWPVRSPDQPVVFRTLIGIPWVDVPLHNGVMPTDRATGYGAMEEGGVFWVTNFIEGRSMEALLIHEVAHRFSGISSNSPELVPIEQQIRERMYEDTV